ncbi:MAG: CoA transferase [Pseudomonadales bacterium]|nr:CoA transferase [Pseudomonadales bacterium]
MKDAPLFNLKVLDMSRVLAGPFAGRLLADLGAEVVKVEPPEGDVTRNWGKQINGISGFYHQQNAGKENISIDLKQTSGVTLFKELAKKADVVLENFRPGVMKKLGIDWEVLHALNPSLIMVSISGFGQSGPESERPAYAPIVHAETGGILRQAAKTGGSARELLMAIADTNAGLHGLVALLAAILQRQQSGLGQHIDIAMVDAMLINDEQTNFFLEDVPVQTGASEVWETSNGPIMIAGDFRHIWRTVNRVLGVPDPTTPETKLAEKVSLRRSAFQEFLFSFNTRPEMLEALDSANLASGGVFSTGEYLKNSATLKHRESIQYIDDRNGGTRPTFQSPYRFSNSSSGVRKGAPHLGEHNTQILQEWLNIEASEIKALEDSKVLHSKLPGD